MVQGVSCSFSIKEPKVLSAPEETADVQSKMHQPHKWCKPTQLCTSGAKPAPKPDHEHGPCASSFFTGAL